MEHSGHLHPEFGLLSPAPRLRRELRIAASSLVFGGIAGALCVSGVIALRHSDRASMEIAAAPTATASQTTASQESDPRSDPSADGRAASPETHAATAARPQASADVSAHTSSETSAPASAIAPKARMVRIRKAVDSPAIARLPLGRSEAPAAAAPPADTPELTQASNAAPAGSDVPASAPEKAGVRPGAREAVANSSPPKKKVQKTVRTAITRRDDIESDLFWRDERTDDWSARPDAPVSADVQGATPDKAATRAGAREEFADSSPHRRRFGMPALAAMTRATIPSGVTSGQMIARLAPPLGTAPMSGASPAQAPGRGWPIRRRRRRREEAECQLSL